MRTRFHGLPGGGNHPARDRRGALGPFDLRGGVSGWSPWGCGWAWPCSTPLDMPTSKRKAMLTAPAGQQHFTIALTLSSDRCGG